VPRYDIPNAAPEPLRLVQRFVNTVDLENEREWLGTPSELRGTLAELGFHVGRLTRADVRAALELREALRSILVANGEGRSAPSPALGHVNRIAEKNVAAVLQPDGSLSYEASGRGLSLALGEIVATAFAAAATGDLSRLKACRHCRWAFYDYSKSRRGTWCSMQLCGNRQKTRRYRARRRGVGRERSGRATAARA
jgi:predicted RNA-binding Zn ribbon-like protein